MKVCSRCKIEKDEEAFYKNNVLKSGLSSACKECTQIKNNEWYQKNIEKASAYKAKWAKENPDNKKRSVDKYVDKNRELCNKKSREYAKNNRWQRNGVWQRQKEELRDSYIKPKLLAQGYSAEDIRNVPALIPMKQIEIINHRLNKQSYAKRSI